MARIDDYIHAIKIAAESLLSTQPLDLLSKQTGFEMAEQSAMRIPFFGQSVPD